ncbi:hypothetical protein K2X30_12480 [bacterium]|nr:hypothetical protein [bacterium]
MKNRIQLGSVLKARCPSCHKGSVLSGVITIRPKCTVCNYNFHPEPGFYLGAMMVGFLLTAMVTVPPMVFLKFMGVDRSILILFPFLEFLFVGTLIFFYSRVFWLHLEYRMTHRLDGHDSGDSQDK